MGDACRRPDVAPPRLTVLRRAVVTLLTFLTVALPFGAIGEAHAAVSVAQSQMLEGRGTPRVLLAAPAADEVDRAVEDVLSRRVFRTARPSWIQRLREAVRSWFAERISDLLAGSSAGLFGWTIIGVGSLVAVALTWRLFRGVRSDPDTDDEILVEPSTRSAAEWWRDADLAAGRGDLRAAIRAAYHGLIVELTAGGTVADTPGRTIGEHRRDVDRNAPGIARGFAVAADRVETVLYGEAVAQPEDLDRLRRLSTLVVSR